MLEKSDNIGSGFLIQANKIKNTLNTKAESKNAKNKKICQGLDK